MPLGDGAGVGAEAFADEGDLVDEADLGGEEGVGCVLDHLGRAGVGDEDGGVEGGVERGDAIGDVGLIGAEDDAIGVEDVVDGGAFAQELRVGDDREGDVGAGVLGEDFGHELDRADGHRALVDDDEVAGGVGGDAAGGGGDVGCIGAADLVRRSADADEGELGAGEGPGVVGREAEASGGEAALEEVVEAGLVDGGSAGLEGDDLALVGIEPDDVVSEVGEGYRIGEPDVSAAADNRNPGHSPPTPFARAKSMQVHRFVTRWLFSAICAD